jgi:N-acetylglucosamine kinase-like BadF-type ATPase
MLRLIADSGSTKTDWTLLFSPAPVIGYEVIATFRTQGITPIHQTPADIRLILANELQPQLSAFPRVKLVDTKVLESSLMQHCNIFFYGSGCTPAHVPMMKQVLAEVLSPKSVEVYSDLMAAARALCQHEAGIACILGTGANSCLYDGEQIAQNTPALGYILGDEGSGSVLGRLFLNAIFKNPKLSKLRDKYLEENKLTQADIIKKVYNEPMVNRFLATTSPFILQHLDNPILQRLVIDNFRQFFRSNIDPYGHHDLPVHFVGSMAYHYRKQLEEAAREEGYTIGQTMQSPMEGLVKYHS